MGPAAVQSLQSQKHAKDAFSTPAPYTAQLSDGITCLPLTCDPYDPGLEFPLGGSTTGVRAQRHW